MFGIDENVEKFEAREATKHDMQRIRIPVCMQLDIPISWDRTKVFEALDEARLNGTPDMNIRIKAISIEDLNIFADISKKLLRNVDVFCSEINTMMSTMLSEAAIDTTKDAQLCVNLEVQDMTDINLTTEEVIVKVQTSFNTNLTVSVNLRQKFKIKKHFLNKSPAIYSCIKTGNKLVLIDYLGDRLIICNSNSTDIHHILLSYTPRYITEINCNTVAISCIDRTILTINISTCSVTSTINTNGDCYGISYNENNLYVVIDRSIIHVMDLTGKVIHTMPLPSDRIFDITVYRDRLVCIDLTSIYCCSLDRKIIWMFTNDEFQKLSGVTTDDEGNVYVTYSKTNNVVVVSDDGQHHRELVTESDGFDEPWGIYFDKQENILLVCNYRDDKVSLFDVTKAAT
ncbi:Hypothetical predicted protein [Mytilus galloprovincialis]|uniref:Uncharacterized protein n=1 Tax=Mytilus galloprovincialis TaxID=29158 RepID=A0A8B6EK06_MYTGA|nr:Hypothetical predicted protein [Mytilus galloprovincialis]